MGETIELDDSREEGFCSYCGSKVSIQTLANQNLRKEKESTINPKLANYIKLAKSAIDGHNGDEALKYANLALEYNAKDIDVISLKMKALILIDENGDNSKLMKYCLVEEKLLIILRRKLSEYILSISIKLNKLLINKNLHYHPTI